MDIVPFIRELILLNECVILRGVGGFETTYKHATFRENGKAIVPPTKQIHFRPDLLVDNGLLERHLSESLGITSKEAADEIDRFVVNIYDQLRESGKIYFQGIGEFTMDENSRLQFRELEDEIYLADSFGLEILDIEERPKHIEVEIKNEIAPLIQTRRKHTGWYVTIGVLLLVIAVTFFILISEESGKGIFSFRPQKVDMPNKTTIVFGSQQVEKPDSVKQVVERTISENTSIRNALAPDAKEIAVSEQPSTTLPGSMASYYLIAGSFKNRNNAEQMKRRMDDDGFSSNILTTKDGFYRIVIGKFSNRQQAIEELRRIRKQIGQSVWLWEN